MTRETRAAVVGMGCRFPGGASTPSAFWRLLESGRDPVGPLPPGRFDVERFVHPEPGTPGRIVTAEGGFLADIDRFDAAFFGLSPREARKIDPQHRLLLEVAWEALEDAGIPPSSLAGRRVGVYVGVWSGEYENVMYRSPAELDFHSITGGGRYAASGRISYAFDLRGPALTVDTGCSASLVALDLARQAIESGDADLAIVGAANLVLQPHVNIGYSRSGMLSAGARCRFGDADAAGYVRSDGAAAVVLRPLHDARSSGDRVRGVLLATAVNADGRGSGQLATPSADAQAALLDTVYARAGVEPGRVPYVEAHGTGTRAGDPVELEALGRVLGRGRALDAPLLVGSVKTNIGHTEAAAGMAGLIKTLLALEHRRIPASLHLKTPSDRIPWTDLCLEIPTRSRDWPAEMPLVAGVSSFGITGTNAHAVVSADPAHGAEANDTRSPCEDIPAVVTLSGRTEEALSDAVRALKGWLGSEGRTARLDDLSYTTTCRREHHAQRLAIVASSPGELMDGLDDHLATESSGKAIVADAAAGALPTIGFVFSGQGSQWVGMGRELMARAPVFGDWIRRCDETLRPLTGWSVLEVLADEGAESLERVEVIQPTLTCVQIALAEQLKAWGVHPQAVVGHSMGEVAAAFCAGALSLEDALRVVAVRSRLLAEIAGQGAMALVDLPEGDVQAHLEGLGGRVSVAAVNGPRSTVLSGDPDAIDRLLEELESGGVFCRRVRVDVASHSAQTDRLLDSLASELSALEPRVPSIPFHSTPRPGAPVDARLDAAYWVDNLRQPVRLMAAARAMIDTGIDTFVEIAPHPVLLSSLADIAADAEASVRTFAGPRRDESELRRSLDLLSRLHVAGAPVAWGKLSSEGARLVDAPFYPWQRERHWIEGWEDWSGERDDSGVHSARPDALDDVAYTVEWQPHEPRSDGDDAGHWLIIGGGGLAEALAERMAASGAEPVLVAHEEDVEAAAREVGANLAGVVHLAGVAGVAGTPGHAGRTEGAAAAFEEALHRAFGGASLMVRALLEASARPTRATLLVTAGVHAAAGRTADLDSVPQAAVWGLARTSIPEHPELRLRVLDLPGTPSLPDSARQIWDAARDTSAEAQLASGPTGFCVPRLVRAGKDAVQRPVRWRKDCAYLVTGGMGDLGLAVAGEMVRGGARRLILSGRTAPPERARWAGLPADHPFVSKAERIRELERGGASIQLATFDVSDERELADYLARYRAEGWPPIRGVVHCAGTLSAKDASWEAFRVIAAGKALGASNLHRALPQLDELILFSSIASVLPQYNANYAAANAVLDALAAARRDAGLPAVSLSWGAWSGAGLVRDPEVARTVAMLESQGVHGFASEDAAALFEWGAGSTVPHLVLARVDWQVAGERWAGRTGASFYPELEGGESTEGAGGAAALLALPESQRARAMSDRLAEIVARVLQLPASAIARGLPLGKQGLDSLMALEFRNRLEGEFGLRLPASTAWNYPTLGVLSKHLLGLLSTGAETGMDATDGNPSDGDRPAGSPGADPSREDSWDGAADIEASLAELAGQSEDDVLRQLRGDG